MAFIAPNTKREREGDTGAELAKAKRTRWERLFLRT